MAYIFCKNDNDSTIYKAKLHNPIQVIAEIATHVSCQRLAYSDGLFYGFRNSLV